MRIVVLTTHSRRGTAVIQALARRSIRIDAVVIDRGSLGPRQSLRKLRRMLRRRGLSETAWRASRRVRRRLKLTKQRVQPQPRAAGGGATAVDYHDYSPIVRRVADPNAEAGVRVLRELEPDLLILGSCRLLNRRVISIPSVGVLNSHPGLLPHYRGVDVIPWAVYQGDPLGVTVHVVDPGIDSGAILARQGFEIRSGDTFGTLAERAATVGAELMADAVERVLGTGRLEGAPQDLSVGRTYTRMPPHLRRQAQVRLSAKTETA